MCHVPEPYDVRKDVQKLHNHIIMYVVRSHHFTTTQLLAIRYKYRYLHVAS